MHCFKGTNELQLVRGNHFGNAMRGNAGKEKSDARIKS